MRVLTPEEMMKWEKLAMTSLSLSDELLMERAGMAIARGVMRVTGHVSRVVALIGKGNNGGDALVALRELHALGVPVSAVLINPENECGISVQRECSRLRSLGIEMESILSNRGWHRINHADVLIDGILGTGYRGTLSPDLQNVIARINQTGKKVVAVDIPSGVDGATAEVSSEAIKATLTVTFGLPKWGLLTDPGHRFTGMIVVSEIGTPSIFLQQSEPGLVLTNEEASQWLPERGPFIHKGNAGHVVVLGGSPGKRGAPELSALGALRSGAGLASVIFDDRDKEIAPKNPEVMVEMDDFPFVELFHRADVLAIGPGLNPHGMKISSFNQLLESFSGPVVADAGAFELFKGNPKGIVRKNGKPLVLTPHPGEFSIFLGKPVHEILSDSRKIVSETARQLNAVVLLKGWRTIIAGPDGEVAVNLTGAPNMATAGMGDVLTGIISSLMAQGLQAFRAAVLGAHIHGLAGQLAWKNGKISGLLAHELAENLPLVLTQLKVSHWAGVTQDFVLYEPLGTKSDQCLSDRGG
ncbi:MAG: NAD(P)H-hydrate dehydratase [Leptospirales bacterium]